MATLTGKLWEETQESGASPKVEMPEGGGCGGLGNGGCFVLGGWCIPYRHLVVLGEGVLARLIAMAGSF